MTLGQISIWKQNLTDNFCKRGLALTCGATALLILPLARYAHKSLAPLFVIFTLVAFSFWIASGRPFRMTAIGWLCATFAAFIMASSLWSITPLITLKTAVSVSGSLAGACFLFQLANILSNEERRIVGIWSAYGGLIGLLIFIGDTMPQEIIYAMHHDYAVYDLAVANFWNPRKSVFIVAMLFIWPWALVAWRHLSRVVAVTILLIFSTMIVLSQADAARGAFLFGIVGAGCAIVLPRLYSAILTASIIIATAALPIAVPYLTNPASPEAIYEGFSGSALHRIVIWKNTAARIVDHPLLGSGFDTARSLYREHGIDEITLLPSTSRRQTIYSEPIPLHPHNVILQIWAETGAVGAALFVVFLVFVIRRTSQTIADRADRALVYAALTSGLFIANVSVGAWQAWWLAAMILISTITIVILSGQSRA